LSLSAISGLHDSSQQLECCTWSGYLFLFGTMVIASVYQVVWAKIMNPVKLAFGKSIVLG
jgi:hypothetical protein